MSDTKYISVTGDVKWARVFERNMDTKYGKKSTIVMSLDDKAQKDLSNVGFRSKIYEEDGVFWTKFTRSWEQQFQDRTEVLGCPKIVNKDGSPFDLTQSIGNGTKATVLLEVYPSKFGVGSRMKEIKIIDHVPYTPPTEDTDGPPVI